MAQAFFEAPILNSPHAYPGRHWELDADGQPTNRIVKLPRVPVADNIPGADVPKFRNLWEHIGKKMPKKGRGAGKTLDPLSLPADHQTALEALYGHDRKTFDFLREEGIEVPPVFIVVCNNTATSKLVYDYVSGFHRTNDDGRPVLENGRLALFRNFDTDGNRLARPNTILIDSEPLESDAALDDDFRALAADVIERFRQELVARTGNIRAFGTQHLCEEVVGRALRRQSYELNAQGRFDVEYADILGVPFDFTAKPVVAPPAKPRETVRVHAIGPDRDPLEIVFPRVEGYRVELPEERLTAAFGRDAELRLTPELVGPSTTKNQGIVGEGVELTIEHLKEMRESTILFHLTRHLLYQKYRDPGEDPKLHLFGQLKRIVRQWLDSGYLVCVGGTYPAQVIYKEIADMAAERIKAAITLTLVGDRPVKAILDGYNPTGSTRFVNFNTSKETRWKTDPTRCHVNWAVCDSDREAQFCQVAEAHPRVLSYVKNQGLGLEVPYLHGSTPRRYVPDFIVRIDDGFRGKDGPEPLNLIVEIKGFRNEDVKDKANAMNADWIPGVNNLCRSGRWAFAEFREVFEIEKEFGKLVEGFLLESVA